MSISYFLVAGFLLLCGGLFGSGYALRWLAAWQALPAAERARVRVGPLCRNIGGALALAGLVFLAGGCYPAFRENGFRWVMVAWFVICIVDVLYIERSGRYQIK